MAGSFDHEAWFNRRCFTLDLAGLSDEERGEGSVFLGGSQAQYVRLGDTFEWNQIGTLVFKWGDTQVVNVLGNILEHNDLPEVTHLIPVSVSTIIEDYIWSLTLQEKDFDPEKAGQRGRLYHQLPFESASIEDLLRHHRKLAIIGKVGTRWVLFGSGTKIRDTDTDQ